MSPFNSSCNDLVHCSSDLRDLGTTTKQSNMAAVEPVDELKECLRAGVEMLLDKLNYRLHEDMDYISTLASCFSFQHCLRAGVEMLLDKLNDRLHEDMDYISTLAGRHSLSSSTGSTAAILDCLVVVPRSLRFQE